MNLPRNMRNKLDNILLVGIYYLVLLSLRTLVALLSGFIKPLGLSVYGTSSKKLVRCALLCACCDLPAGRRLGGFHSYNAHKGCSWCLKLFPEVLVNRTIRGLIVTIGRGALWINIGRLIRISRLVTINEWLSLH